MSRRAHVSVIAAAAAAVAAIGAGGVVAASRSGDEAALQTVPRGGDRQIERRIDDDRDPPTSGASPSGLATHRAKSLEDGTPTPGAQYNFTDPQSRILEQGGGFVQGYNCHVAVDGRAEQAARADAGRSLARQQADHASRCGGAVWMSDEPVHASRSNHQQSKIDVSDFAAETDRHRARFKYTLDRLGISSLRLDYRDRTSFEECLLDALISLALLKASGIKEIAIVGHQLGGAVAIAATALTPWVKGVVAIAARPQAIGFVDRIAPRPLLVLHGGQDTQSPLTVSEDLFAAAQEPNEAAAEQLPAATTPTELDAVNAPSTAPASAEQDRDPP